MTTTLNSLKHLLPSRTLPIEQPARFKARMRWLWWLYAVSLVFMVAGRITHPWTMLAIQLTLQAIGIVICVIASREHNRVHKQRMRELEAQWRALDAEMRQITERIMRRYNAHPWPEESKKAQS